MRSVHQQSIPACRRLSGACLGRSKCERLLFLTSERLRSIPLRNCTGLMSAMENISQDSVRDVSRPSSADKEGFHLTNIFQTSFKTCALGKHRQQRQAHEVSSPEGLYPAQTRAALALIHIIKLSKLCIPQ